MLHGTVVVSTTRVTCWPARTDGSLRGPRRRDRRGPGLGPLRPGDRRTARRTSPWRWPAPSTSAPCCCTACPTSSASPTGAPWSAGALVTALVLLFGRIGGRGRGAGPRRAAQRPARAAGTTTRSRLRERARRQHADLDGSHGRRRGRRRRASTGTAPPRSRPGSAASCTGSAGSTTAGWCWWRRPRRTPLSVGRQLRERAGRRRSCTVGVAPVAGRPGRGRRRRTARRGSASTRWCPGPRPARSATPPGLGLARLLLGGTAPRSSSEFIERRSGRCWPTTPVAAPSWSGPWRRGSRPAARPAETAKRLHVHPNTVAQRLDRIGTLLGEDWRDPARRLDVQLALRLRRLVPLTRRVVSRGPHRTARSMWALHIVGPAWTSSVGGMTETIVTPARAPNPLTGRTALVTGGASGIGRAVARPAGRGRRARPRPRPRRGRRQAGRRRGRGRLPGRRPLRRRVDRRARPGHRACSRHPGQQRRRPARRARSRTSTPSGSRFIQRLMLEAPFLLARGLLPGMYDAWLGPARARLLGARPPRLAVQGRPTCRPSTGSRGSPR